MTRYEELIKEMNPKPVFNLKYYKNNDQYSEGDVEDLIIELIAANAEEDYVKAIADHFHWSTYYHLTHTRRNILNWYPFKKEANVLEIGCGLGAITNMLCERCRKVTAVELSKRRAAATLLRCRERENLEIIVGNLNDIEFKEKFDYITLIGVLEYQGSYTDMAHPYVDFLKKIKALLKPNGKLLIAIENQYGLKYWCGAREDHTGVPFDGINQYNIGSGSGRTFSRKYLERMIRESGFLHTFFYYPMPDYKLPVVIYSQDYLPQDANMHNMKCYYAPDKKTLIADEAALYKDILENNAFEFMANSFLVECSDATDIGEITFALLNDMRAREYRMGTRFTKDGKVEKFQLLDGIEDVHIQQILMNEKEMSAEGLDVLCSEFSEGRLSVDYLTAPLAEKVLIEACRAGEAERASQMFEMLWKEILKSSEQTDSEKNLLYVLGIGTADSEKYGPILRKGYLDMILRNAVWENGRFRWFDQEWMLENVPAKFVFYRALAETYKSFSDIDEYLPFEKVAKDFGLIPILKELKQLEELFGMSILDMDAYQERMAFCNPKRESFVENIARIGG
ncbi:MAG: class I SAM-dependent methyltransferase [Clostridiales bacterium]|nr:class I SAM-dependent methyltransferase [Roseburia sp.]MDD7637186.1 class I SAM-dependent methyltransferase [Clostridiales bacterium]